jgi:hypothetical protein
MYRLTSIRVKASAPLSALEEPPTAAQTLPADVRIEQPRRSFEITAPKGAEEVDHDRLEVLLADAWHLFLLLSVTSSTAG